MPMLAFSCMMCWHACKLTQETLVVLPVGIFFVALVERASGTPVELMRVFESDEAEQGVQAFLSLL